jgi:hypothetical protein
MMILLDKGANDGVKNGFLFRVYTDVDPYSQRTDTLPPDFKGEVQVISVGRLSSVGYIVRNTNVLVAGDVLVPTKDFPNPAPPPVKAHEILEIP